MSDPILRHLKNAHAPWVVMAVGIPGSGKSYYLKPLAEKLDCTYIDLDTLREWLFGDVHNHSQNPLVWQIVKTSIHAALVAGRSVVLDGINTFSDYRAEEVELYKSFGAKQVIALLFDTPLQECIKRNRQRGRVVPEDFIKQAHEDLLAKRPGASEGFNAVLTLAHDR